MSNCGPREPVTISPGDYVVQGDDQFIVVTPDISEAEAAFDSIDHGYLDHAGEGGYLYDSETIKSK